MICINVGTFRGTLGYRVGRFLRNVRALCEELAFVLACGAMLGLLLVHAFLVLPFRRSASRLAVAVSLITLLALTAIAALLVTQPAGLATAVSVVVALAVAAALTAMQAFPSDCGFWMIDLQDQLRELIDGPER